MLQNLRAASSTWTGRIFASLLMGFIVLSFVIFGIGDFFRGTVSTVLAHVGPVEIPADAFRTMWERQLQQSGQRTGRRVTSEDARAAGLDTQLMNQLVNDAALDLRTRQLGLAVPDAGVRAAIEATPAFMAPGGRFEQARLNEVLRENGLSLAGFVAEQRRLMLRQQLAQSLAGDVAAPRALAEAYNKLRNETRSVDTVLLPDSAAGEIAKPSEEELAAWFAARAQGFRAPEYRKLVALALHPDALAKPDAVPEADVRKRYEEVKAQRFTVAERRGVQKIAFPGEDEAKVASERIKAGTSFAAIAQERGLADKDIDLGEVANTGLAGETGKVAFALPEGGTSEPVGNVKGFALVHVTKIVPGSTTPFETAAPELRRELAAVAARKTLQDLHDRIEDARTGGKDLAAAAKDAGLEARVIEALDAGGRDKAGTPVPDLPDAALLLKAAFASDKGVDNETIQTKDRGSVWFEVAAIDPARPRALEEMRADAEAGWRADETAKRLAAKAAELVGKLKGGAKLADLAQAEGKLEVVNINDVKRDGAKKLPPGVVAQIFNVPVGGAGSGAAAGGRIVFSVLDSAVAPLDAEAPEARALAAQLREALADDLLAQYVAQAKAEAGVTINSALLRQLAGGESGGQ